MRCGSVVLLTLIISSLTCKPVTKAVRLKNTFVVVAGPSPSTEVTVRFSVEGITVIPSRCRGPRVMWHSASIFASFAQPFYHWDATASFDFTWLRLLGFLIQYAKDGDDNTCFPNASPCLPDSSLGDTSSRVESKIFSATQRMHDIDVSQVHHDR